MEISRRIFHLFAALAAAMLVDWTHGVVVVPPGQNVVDDFGTLVVDDFGVQVVDS